MEDEDEEMKDEEVRNELVKDEEGASCRKEEEEKKDKIRVRCCCPGLWAAGRDDCECRIW